VRAWLGAHGFVAGVQTELAQLAQVAPKGVSREKLAESLEQVNLARREARSPAESLIHDLHPWVAFGIMPVFALANAGVSLSGGAIDASGWSVILGVGLGLVLGKPIGILLAIGLTLRLRVGTLPAGLGLPHLLVLGIVAGIGFTMALFIAQLAFESPQALAAAKIGVLAASAAAAVLGLALGRALLGTVTAPGVAATADEAERSTEA
jgi:NhaA family Na+:H+ antiporter